MEKQSSEQQNETVCLLAGMLFVAWQVQLQIEPKPTTQTIRYEHKTTMNVRSSTKNNAEKKYSQRPNENIGMRN